MNQRMGNTETSKWSGVSQKAIALTGLYTVHAVPLGMG